MSIVSKGILALSIFGLTATGANAQIIVKVRPLRPKVVVVKPVAPSPRHVWVDEDWVEDHGKYRWHGGYWVAPPHPHAVWIAGHWAGRHRGYRWIPGHWR